MVNQLQTAIHFNVMSIDQLVQWQIWDDQTDACFPWFTHPFLEVLKTWDLSGKRILEWGAGRSTRWWRKKAAYVVSVDTSVHWKAQVIVDCFKGNVQSKGEIICFDGMCEGDPSRADEYTEVADTYGPFDIVVIDAIHRHECLLRALALPRPLTIIHDNWQQDGFVCPASEELMAPYEIHNFIQEDHTDNHGRKWATAYWHLT